MAWSKVGEYVTDILVNGTQEASYNQSSDSNYDVDISTSATLNQSEADLRFEMYSDDLLSDGEIIGSSSANNPINANAELLNTDSIQYRLALDVFDSDGNGAGEFYVNGSLDNSVGFSSGDPATSTSNWHSTTPNGAFYFKSTGGDMASGGSGSVHLYIEIRVISSASASSSYTVNGVTKS